MSHIHTAPGQHDHTVSFFIIRTDFPEPKLVFHVHRRTGLLMMFGGHIELDETPWHAALREITEETGYDHDQLRILQPSVRLATVTGGTVHPVPAVSSTGQYPGPTPHYHSDSLYALLADSAPNGSPAAGEATDIRLLTLSELAAVPSVEMDEMWREIGVHILTSVYRNWASLPLSAFA